jgi:Clp amino terminal domain, pathogenicity island component
MTTNMSVPPRLDDLIGAVAEAHDGPLDRVAGAVQLAEELGDVADSLVGHFVDEARRDGASWSQIGRSMGMTKQAAQQRFVPRRPTEPAPLDPSQGFSRFDGEARAVVVSAQERARGAGHDSIGVGHLVLGLVADPGSAAARAVSAQGVSLQEVERVATATLPAPAATVPALIPFDPQAKAALERTFAEAQRRGAERIGSAHVLLALLALDEGTGVLAGLGVATAGVEDRLSERS